MKSKKRTFIFFILTFSFIYCIVFPQQKKSISIDWIYSPEPGSITRMPQVSWLNNGNGIITDFNSTEPDKFLQIFDPVADKMTPLFNNEKALLSIKSLLGDKSPVRIGRPDPIDPTGRKGLFRFDNKLFILDFNSSEFTPINSLSGEEKNIRFSPNGEYFAFVRSNDIYIYDLNSKSEKRMTFDGSETILNGTLSWVYWEEIFGRSDLAYWWSDDSKAIAYLQSDESPVSVIYFSDFLPATPRVIKQRYAKTGEANPIVKAGIVEIENAQTKWVDFGNFKYEYLVRFLWLPGSSELSIQTLNRKQDELNLFFASRSTGKAKHILKETDPGWVNIHDDLHFIENGKEFLWVSERTGFAHIYRYTIDGKLINQITKGEWALAASGGAAYWVRGAISSVDDKNKTVYFTANEKSPLEKHLYSIKYDGTGFKRITSGDGTHRISFNSSSKFFVDNYSTINTPAVSNLYSNDGKLIKEIGSYNKTKLEELNLQRPELFTINARDGFILPAEIMKPADFDPDKKYPLVIYVYGGPSAPQVLNSWRNSIYYDNVLLNNGFLTAIVDCRASTAISKSLENLLLGRFGGEVELNDLVDGVRWFKNQSYIDSSRIGVWGWSGGGTYTLNAVVNSKEFKAAIAVAPVTDWKFYDTRFGEMGMKTAEDNPEGYSATSLVSRAKNLHGKLMLVHGTYDDNVHIQNTWAFIDELIKAGKLFELQVYPMRKHGISDLPAQKHLYNTMLDFWKRNL